MGNETDKPIRIIEDATGVLFIPNKAGVKLPRVKQPEISDRFLDQVRSLASCQLPLRDFFVELGLVRPDPPPTRWQRLDQAVFGPLLSWQVLDVATLQALTESIPRRVRLLGREVSFWHWWTDTEFLKLRFNSLNFHKGLANYDLATNQLATLSRLAATARITIFSGLPYFARYFLVEKIHKTELPQLLDQQYAVILRPDGQYSAAPLKIATAAWFAANQEVRLYAQEDDPYIALCLTEFCQGVQLFYPQADFASLAYPSLPVTSRFNLDRLRFIDQPFFV